MIREITGQKLVNKTMKWVVIVTLLANLVQSERQGQERRRLVMVLELISPGARTSKAHFYKKNGGDWIKKYGDYKLTATGMRQSYISGLQMYQDYSEFFAEFNFSKNPVSATSANWDSSFNAAQAHLTGLFRFIEKDSIPFGEMDPRFKPNFDGIEDEDLVFGSASPNLVDFIQTNIQVSKDQEDSLFFFEISQKCKSQNIKRLIIEYKKLGDIRNTTKQTEFVDEFFGIQKSRISLQLVKCYRAGLITLTESYSNDPDSKIKLEKDSNFVTVVNCFKALLMGSYTSDEVIRTHGSPFMIRVLEDMIKMEIEQKRNDSRIDIGVKQKKFKLYSAFEKSILHNLFVLGVYSRECVYAEYRMNRRQPGCIDFPINASNMVYELEFDDLAQKALVSVRYNGRYVRVCDAGDVQDKVKYSCFLDKFVEKVEKNINPGWRKSCGDFKDADGIKNHSYGVIFGLLFGGILSLIVMIMAIIMLKWKFPEGQD